MCNNAMNEVKGYAPPTLREELSIYCDWAA